MSTQFFLKVIWYRLNRVWGALQHATEFFLPVQVRPVVYTII